MADDSGFGSLDDVNSELEQYIADYGVDVGIALFKEDYELPLNDNDVAALERFAHEEETDSVSGDGPSDFDYSPLTDSGGDYDSEPDSDYAEIGQELEGPDYPAIDEVIGDYDRYEPDIGLDLTPDGDDFEPYALHYEIYLNDGSVIEGEIMIYHEDTDIEDAIWAANDDVDYDDALYVNYG